jgi:hypothetical protein
MAVHVGRPPVCWSWARWGASYWWAKRLVLDEARRRRFQLALVAHVLADAAGESGPPAPD